MIMNKTILSKKDLEILEKILLNYGNIVSTEQIKTILPDYSYDEANQRIKLLAKRGWLVRIKRGSYAVASLESHSFADISPLVLAQIFIPDSYVSFEFALNNYGIFDQLPNKVTSVTPLKSKNYTFQNLDYKFVKAKPEMMIGFNELKINNHLSKVADIEKALIDFLHFRKDIYTIDLVKEKLDEAKASIDLVKLSNYSNPYPEALKRRLGFLLDLTGIESEGIYHQIKKNSGNAKLTKNSNIFNAKWRLYYEDRFNK